MEIEMDAHYMMFTCAGDQPAIWLDLNTLYAS